LARLGDWRGREARNCDVTNLNAKFYERVGGKRKKAEKKKKKGGVSGLTQARIAGQKDSKKRDLKKPTEGKKRSNAVRGSYQPRQIDSERGKNTPKE